MNVKHIVILLSVLLLSGCASVSSKDASPHGVIKTLSSQDKTQFNINMNTALDNTPVTWHSADRKTTYTLTTRNTHVNAKGMPCRDYTLVIDRDYHRKSVTTAVACREENGWKPEGA